MPGRIDAVGCRQRVSSARYEHTLLDRSKLSSTPTYWKVNYLVLITAETYYICGPTTLLLAVLVYQSAPIESVQYVYA